MCLLKPAILPSQRVSSCFSKFICMMNHIQNIHKKHLSEEEKNCSTCTFNPGMRGNSRYHIFPNGNALNSSSQTTGRVFLGSLFLFEQRERFLVIPVPVQNSGKFFLISHSCPVQRDHNIFSFFPCPFQNGEAIPIILSMFYLFKNSLRGIIFSN